MSEESIENISKSDSNFAPNFVDHHLLQDMNFSGRCLIKNNISIPKKVINLYISYTLSSQLRNLNTNFTLSNCLFGSVKLTKNTDLDVLDGLDVTIFGADMSSSAHVYNKEKDFLILVERST